MKGCMWWIAVGTVVLATTLVVAAPNAVARPVALCFGSLSVSPARVHIGGTLTLRGHGFTCTMPTGKRFPIASLFLYKPGFGFFTATAKIPANGTYSLTVRIPKTLITVKALNGAPPAKVATVPGAYYISIRLMDAYLPPAKEANAHFTVIR